MVEQVLTTDEVRGLRPSPGEAIDGNGRPRRVGVWRAAGDG